MNKSRLLLAGVLLSASLQGLSQAEVVVHTGHPGHAIKTGGFSPDGKYFLTFDETGTYIVWETATGKEIRRLVSPMEGIDGMVNEYHDEYRYFSLPSISRNDEYCITLGEDRGVYALWRLSDGRLVKKFDYRNSGIQGACQHVVFTADGTSVLINIRNRTGQCLYRVVRYDISSGREEVLFDYEPPIRSDGKGAKVLDDIPRCIVAAMNATADLRYFAFGMADGRVLVVDRQAKSAPKAGALLQGRDMTTLIPDVEFVNLLAFIPNSQMLITGTMNYVDVWDLRKGALLRRINASPCRIPGIDKDTTSMRSFTLSGNGRMLVRTDCGNTNLKGVVTTFDVYSGKIVRKDSSNHDYDAVSDDGRFLHARGLSFGAVVNNQTQEALFSRPDEAMMLTNAGFLDNGRTLFIGTAFSNAWLIDLNDAKVARLRNFPRLTETVSPGRMDFDEYVLNTHKAATCQMKNVILSRDGRKMYVADLSMSPCDAEHCDSSFFVWDVATCQLVGADQPYSPGLDPFNGIKRMLVFADDNRMIVNTRIWSRATKKYLDFDNVKLYCPFMSSDPKTFYNLKQDFTDVSLRKTGFVVQTIDAATLEVITEMHLYPAKPFPTVEEMIVKDLKHLTPVRATVGCLEEYALLSKDEKILLTATHLGSDDLFVLAWDFRTGRELARFEVKGQESRGTDDPPYSLDIASDNSTVALGAYDKNIYIWQIGGGGKLLFTLKGHNAPVHSVAFSPNGDYLVSVSADRTCRLWDMHGARQVLSFSTNGRRDYILRDPEGYYMGTKGGARSVHFVKGERSYSFDQFDLQYNRPDKILAHLRPASPVVLTAYERAWHKRLQKMGFDSSVFAPGHSFDIPTVELAGPAAPEKTAARVFRCDVRVRDSLYTLDRLNVYVNGVPLYGKRGRSLRAMASRSVQQQLEIPLAAGDNRIEISALNEKGVASEPQKITVECTAAAVRNLYLICIGAANYKDPSPALQLVYPAKDARNIDSLFRTGPKRFRNIYSHVLVNQDVTRRRILDLRRELLHTTPDDEVLIFYAGHGVVDGDMNYYLATYDMDFSRPAVNGMPYDELESLLDSIPARSKICLVDACYSGEFDKEEAALAATQRPIHNVVLTRGAGDHRVVPAGPDHSFELMKQLFVDLRRSTGATVISSAGGRERAYEDGRIRNGVFTHCVITGLRQRKADLNGDGKITLSELQDYVQGKVAELTGGMQVPTSRTENFDNDFVIW